VLRLGLVVLVLLIGAATPAQAGPILTGSVIDARLCADSACDTVTMTLETVRPAPGPVTGTLEIDPATLRIEFDLVLESAVLSGADDIWTRLELHDMRFQGGGTLTLAIRAKTGWAITDGTAQVDGTFVAISPLTDRPFNPPIPFSATPTLGGICRQLTDIHCSRITFGPGEFVIPFDGGRYLSISLAASVPEPETLVFVVLGVAAISMRRLWA
jgi:hypothetical protein